MNVEEWRAIENFPAYEVSSLGRVRRCKPGAPGARGVKVGRILKSQLDGRGYPKVNLRQNGKTVNCRVHRLVGVTFFGVKADLEVDHKFHHLSDFINLRPATHQQNTWNMKPQREGASRYKGVFWRKSRQKWKAQIAKDGRSKFLGHFKREKDAARAYDRAAAIAFGEFAYLNFKNTTKGLTQ
jgi:NUMOD4 motif/AP2 domain